MHTKRKSSFKVRPKVIHKDEEDEEKDDSEEGGGGGGGRNGERKRQKKSRRTSWEGVKDRRRGEEEELKSVRSLGVVKKRLKDRVKVREQAVKFFKHRYVLDQESTHASNTILVTGYEPSSGEAPAKEVIRKQSSIVISNFFDHPSRPHPVLSRLTSRQREGLERVVVGGRGGRGGEHTHTHSEPVSEKGAELTGKKKVWFRRGSSIEVTSHHHGDEGHHHGDGEVIPRVGRAHTRTKSAPGVTTPIAPPPPVARGEEDMLVTTADTPPVPFPYPMSAAGMKNGSLPSPLKRSSSYVSAMEADDMVAMETNDVVAMATPKEKPRKGQGSPRVKGKGRLPRFLLRGKKKGDIAESAKPSRLGSTESNEGAELAESDDDVVASIAETAASAVVMEKEESLSSPESPKRKPISFSRPLDPPPRGHAHQRGSAHQLKPQFSITSLPSLDLAPRKYYTPVSPRVDKVTGTYAGDVNPFAQDFDRALQESASGGHAPTVTRSNTQLPEDLIADEGFQEFLMMNDAKPSTSMYITYQIQLISDKIDCKYGQHLNQALDEIIPQIITNAVTWENFRDACRSLMFKGEGLNEGVFMVPAFARRLLGFLPGMRDTITSYTQKVLEDYAMDWLLIRGGWVSVCVSVVSCDRHVTSQGELLRHNPGGAGDEGAWSSDNMWVWPCDEGEMWEEEEREELFHVAMGYGLVTPGPEVCIHTRTHPSTPTLSLSLSRSLCAVSGQITSISSHRCLSKYCTQHLSNQDTNGAEESVIVSEVSSFQRLKCMQEWYLGWEKCPV